MVTTTITYLSSSLNLEKNNPSSSSSSSMSSSLTLLNPPIKLTRFSSNSHNSRELKPWRVEVRPLLGYRCAPIHCHTPATITTNIHSDLGMLFEFLNHIGFDIKETEYLLSKNPVLKSASFESVRARILSLNSIGINGMPLYHLVMKNPTVLTSNEVDSFIHFVFRNDLNDKIKPLQFHKLLTPTNPTLLVGFDKKVQLLLRIGIPPERISHVLNGVNLSKAICLKSVEDIEAVFSFLTPYGGTELILKLPAILNFDLATQLTPKVLFLKELSGGDEQKTGTVLRKLPAILKYSLDHLKNHVDFLKSFAGLNNEQVFKIFFVFPGVVSASKDRKLHPRIKFLKQCGLDSNDIYKFLCKAPLFLGLSYEDNLVHKLGLLVKIGYRYRTKEFTVAVGAVTRTSCENMQKVIGLFFSYGLSYENILAMSTKHPQVLQYSHDSLEEKMEYLIEGMGRDIEELLRFPAFLGYRLNDRIKLRYEFKKTVSGEGMSLNKLLAVSTERFSAKNKKIIVVHNG